MRIAALTTGLLALLALVTLASRAGIPWSGESQGAEGRSLVRLVRIALLVLVGGATLVLAVAFVSRLRRPRRPAIEEDEEEEAAEEGRTSRLERILLQILPYALVGAIALGLLLAAREIDRRWPDTAPSGGGPAQTADDERRPARTADGEGRSGAALVLIAGVGILLVLTVGVAAAPAVRRRVRATFAGRSVAARIADVVDESIDDLHSEPDPRRAVIAAYARMERGLASYGLPRRQFEAPLEYMSRILLDLRAGRRAVGRLTDLFERAKFSRREVEAGAKEEAIECLLVIRDGIREAQ